MKKAIMFILIVVLVILVMPGIVYGDKPDENKAGAQKVEWNLSGAVMPIPPYGTGDIPGSDTASKLIVNQPNGNTVVTLTGVMKGLDPNTTYTVFVSNGYEPYVETGWDVSGSYVIDLMVGSAPYTEYLELSQDGLDIKGDSLALAGNASPWTIDSGTVNGTTVEFLAHYNAVPTLQALFNATIAADGSLIDGVWADVDPGTRSGTWASTSGTAVKTYTGDDWWTGLFTSTVPAFTFTTDEFGSGSWHINLKDADFPGLDTYELSVWINGSAGSILASDVFEVIAG